MKKHCITAFLMLMASLATAEETYKPLFEREMLLGDVMGLREYLSDNGISLDTGATLVYQANTHGGLSTNDEKGRNSGSYDIEISIDAEKVFGFEGGSFYILSEGSWTDAEGIDSASVGSLFGINDDVGGDRAFDITELWYEQVLPSESDLRMRIGKIDLTGGFECRGCPVAFDSSMYANDETSQFLNGALVNNPTIPFPDNGLGAVLFFSPENSGSYLAFGIADALADARTAGFDTAFNGDDDFFYILETGFTTSPAKVGTYRFGIWHDPQPKSAADASSTNSGDTGLYASLDQKISNENDIDDQGLGAFFRYGYAPERTNDITQFFSAGFQYKGLIDDRDEDVFAVGFAQGNISDEADTTYPAHHEAVYEIYYNAQLTQSINITPSIQYIVDPGANNTADDALVFALRAQIAF